MTGLKTVGLFAGIGGIELGLERAGHHTSLLCEVDEVATAVLTERFDAEHFADVTKLKSIGSADLLAAGFPCQDLSQAGRKSGIEGSQSGLVGHVFRLIQGRKRPDWLLLENVSYMLRLDRGQAMNMLTSELELLGYRWAYRVVDARAFGVAQRRQRVILLASRKHDPRDVLFVDDFDGDAFDDSVGAVDPEALYGFYWTEGLRGLGWTKNATPTIKSGSKLGIPSAPAIWDPLTGEVGTPQIRDGEILQGFDADWTLPAQAAGHKAGFRWRLVGNAVCVGMAEWVGRRLVAPGVWDGESRAIKKAAAWPLAAWGDAKTGRHAVALSMRPYGAEPNLRGSLTMPLRPLSVRATAGFLERAHRSNLRFAEGFIGSLESHLDAVMSGNAHPTTLQRV